jgi:hypothetical protein
MLEVFFFSKNKNFQTQEDARELDHMQYELSLSKFRDFVYFFYKYAI